MPAMRHATSRRPRKATSRSTAGRSRVTRRNDLPAPWLRYVTAATVDMVRYYAQDNPEMLAEGASAADRARAAGAVGVLDLQGIGMTAWVFCDEQGVAFKVARNMTPSNVEMLAREAEWLRVANAVPGVKMHVARFYRWHPEVGVIVRECVRQRDRSTMRRRKQDGDLWDLHRSIERSMLPYGFTAPELKADSYVFTRDRGYVLVDAGFVHKTGSRLARDIAAKHRDQSMRKEELSLERGVMRSEYGRTIDPEVGARLERRLAASRPNGAKRGAAVTLYHTTYARNLPSIAKHGLRPAAKAALMRAAPGNIRGVYLSSAEGVPFWFRKLVDWAQHDSDDPVGDGMVPVVLRVTTTCDTVEDTVGSRDAMSDAVVCSRPIVPGAIRVWDGERWVPLSQGVDQHKGARWVEDEDFDEGGYADLLGPYESPLAPRL